MPARPKGDDMKKILAAVAVVLAALVGAQASRAAQDSPGAVFALTNSAAGNAVAYYARSAQGALSYVGAFPTGGLGAGANLGSQGSVTLSDDGRSLYAVNAGSNSVSVFSVQPNGLELTR